MESARTSASPIVLIGLSTEICFTSERFQAMRRKKVLMRTVSTNTKSSVTTSDRVLDLETS
jgi:hypothetical protein